MLNCPRRLTAIAGLLLGAAVFPFSTPASAAKPERKIEVSSEKTEDGQSSVTVVISGIPPEELGSEGMKALLGYLTGHRSLDSLAPQTKERAKSGEPAAPAPRAAGDDRDEREFDLELNIHWRRATDDEDDDSKDEVKKARESKGAGEPKTRQSPKDGGTAIDSFKKMISGGAGTPAPAKGEQPADATKGNTRRNEAEVDAILRSLSNLQKQIAEQTKGAERVKGLAESAGKSKGTPESEREIRKVAEAAAELEKLARDLEKRSREVEEALGRARSKLSEAGPGSAGGSKETPKKKPKKQRKQGLPKTVTEPQ